MNKKQTANAAYKAELARDKPIKSEHIDRRIANVGFYKVKTQALRTMTGTQYESIVSSEPAWAELTARMNDYFDDEFELFPFKQGDAKAVKSGLFKRLARALRGVAKPPRYHIIQKQSVEKRFPGGTIAGQPGDGDMRDIISALRIVFVHNLTWFVFLKLVIECLSILLIVWLGDLFDKHTLFAGICDSPLVISLHLACSAAAHDFLSSTLLYISLFIGILVVFFSANWIVDHCYKGAQTESCLFVSGQAAIRTKNLSNLFDEFYPRIDKDRAELDSRGATREWPLRSRRWMTLTYWLAKRLEYVERFVQIEIWRIRRIHHWINLGGRTLNLSIITAGLACVVLHWLFRAGGATPLPSKLRLASVPHWQQLVDPAWLLLHLVMTGLILTVSVTCFLLWNSSLDLIEDKLQPENWNRFHSVRLQDRIADQVFNDKQTILQREEMLAGKKNN